MTRLTGLACLTIMLTYGVDLEASQVKVLVCPLAKADGAYTNRSTKKTDRTQAKKVAQAYEDIGRQRSSEAHIRRVMSIFFNRYLGTAIATETIGDYFNRWLVRKGLETEPRTVENTGTWCRGFLAGQRTKAVRDLSYLTVGEISAFRDDVSKRVRAATVNVYLKCSELPCRMRGGRGS